MATLNLNISARQALNVLVLFLLLSVGCTRTKTEERLEEIDRLTETTPVAALDSLSKLKGIRMTEAELNRRRVLVTKARDKAYIRHKSADMIQEAVDYYSRHGSREQRGEAFYYAGRVYSDIGDYPTALRYFQDALDILPSSGDSKDLKLRGNVLSQTARLLNTLRLYKEAIPYLDEVIKIDSALSDTMNLIYDIDLSGAVNMHIGDYNKAESLFVIAEQISNDYEPSDYGLKGQLYRAAIKYNEGDKIAALNLIRNVPENISDDYKFTALGYAASIYRENELFDTAYMYSRELISFPGNRNIKAGYEVLLSPEVRKYLKKDSIDYFYNEYKRYLEEYVRKNGDRQALIQLSQYNYQLHENQRIKAEADRRELEQILLLVIILVCIVTLFYLFAKYRLKKNVLELIKTRDYIYKLNFIVFEPKSNDNFLLLNKSIKYIECDKSKKSQLEKIVADRRNEPSKDNLQKEVLENLQNLVETTGFTDYYFED